MSEKSSKIYYIIFYNVENIDKRVKQVLEISNVKLGTNALLKLKTIGIAVDIKCNGVGEKMTCQTGI